MKIKRIEHVAIAVGDLAKSKRMLADLFGLDVTHEEQINRVQLAMFAVGDSAVELLQSDDPTSRASRLVASSGSSLFHICFEVDDIDAALEELKAKGTKLIHDQPIPGHGNSRIAFVDPASTDGFLIELAELPPTHA